MMRFVKYAVLTIGMLIVTLPAEAIFRKPQPPDWVISQISDPDYFIGIGSAPIVRRRNNHVEQAKKDALNELASEISVEIYSSNVLITLVRNDRVRDEFSSLIRSRVATDLEGYQLFSTYRDKNNYWVYYRLPKALYYKQQEQKRASAVAQARSAYLEAIAADRNGDIRMAIVYYVKCIDAVRFYLHDNIVSEIDGWKVDLVTQSYARVRQIIQSLQVLAPSTELEVLFSSSVAQSDLLFTLQYTGGTPVATFPVFAHYSETALREPVRLTNQSGEVQFELPVIRSRQNAERITVNPDIDRVLQESGVDFVVRRAILDIPVPTVTIPVKIRKPAIRFELKEMVDGMPVRESMLTKILTDLSIMNGFVITEGDADFTAFIETNTKVLSQVGGIYTTELRGDIILIDKDDNIRYTARIPSLKGMQLNLERSATEAYRVLGLQFGSRWFREMIEAMTR